MKQFFQFLRQYVGPYQRYMWGSLVFNLLSAVLNVFSFASLIPMLNLLFEYDPTKPPMEFWAWDTVGASFKDVLIHNMYFYTEQIMREYGGPGMALIIIGVFLMLATLLKTSCYFASAAMLVPMRTGIVRDIRSNIYKKITILPIAFFSDERKGDIIARMSGDVNEIENSITGSLEMLVKNPILLCCYFGVLIYTSWQLTIFTIVVLPLMGWIMGKIGRKLKRKSLEAQNKWSDTMAQLEETLGGMRIIKAFRAERKMQERFNESTNEYRNATSRVSIRQASAHPVSEFLGTCLIVLVLWYGGMLIFSNPTNPIIDAPTFIFYMVILYSIIQPLKDLSKATYSIPKGMASVERINKILLAENPIHDTENPQSIDGLKEGVEFKNIHFSYNGKQEVLSGINMTVKRGQTIAIVGQSGSGKSTLINYLMEQGLNLHFSISATSRPPRGEEKHGVEYFFLSPEEFKQRIDNGELLEYVEVYEGRYYGTLKAQVDEQLARGENVVCDVDVLGAEQIKAIYGERALSVFVQPPSVEALRERLTGRATDAPEVIEQRIARAEYELTFASKFDTVVINDDLATAQQDVLRKVKDFLQQ